MIRRFVAIAVLSAGLATFAGCSDPELTPGDKRFCDTAAQVAQSPASTSGVDLDAELLDVVNKDLQELGAGVRDKSESDVKITANKIVDKCRDLGYTPQPS